MPLRSLLKRFLYTILLGTLLFHFYCKHSAPDKGGASRDSSDGAVVVDSTATVPKNDSLTRVDTVATANGHIKKDGTPGKIRHRMKRGSRRLPGTGSATTGDGKPVVKKRAILGYSYFREMKRNETKYIHAYISINHPESKVRDTLKTLNTADALEKGNDTSSIFTRNMSIYRYVHVTLVNANDSTFKIVPVHDSARQQIDTAMGNHWQWAVTPTTEEKTGLLIIKVVAETPDGNREPFSSQSIPIKIDIGHDLFRRVWAYMMDNPGVVLTAILIPLLGFLGRSIFIRNRKKE